MVLPDGELLDIVRGRAFLSKGNASMRLPGGRLINIPAPGYKMPHVKSSAGYFWKDGMDLIDLFIGQEGTLSVIYEIEMALEKTVEVVALVDTTSPFIRLGRNSVVTFQFTRYLDAADDKAARSAALDSLIAAQTASKKPLKIEVNGYSDGRYWQFSNATIKSHKPRRYLTSPMPRWAQTYDVIATGLTYTAPP